MTAKRGGFFFRHPGPTVLVTDLSILALGWRKAAS